MARGCGAGVRIPAPPGRSGAARRTACGSPADRGCGVLRRLHPVAAPGGLALGAPLVAPRPRAASPAARVPTALRAARPSDRAQPRAPAAAARTARHPGRPGGGAARRRWRRQIDLRRGTCALARPPRSLTTLLVGGLLKARRALGPTDGTSVLDLLRHVCTARDRYRLFARARRCADAGGIALCERYPVAQNRLLVGPEIPQLYRRGRDRRRASSLARR